MFKVYSKGNCSYCEAVEKLFKMKNIEYVKFLLNCEFNKEDFINTFGKDATFPRVIGPDNDLIGGAAETVKYLKDRNLA